MGRWWHPREFLRRALTEDNYAFLLPARRRNRPAVGATAAVRSPTVLASTRLLSESVAQLPLHLFRRGADNARERDGDHRAAQAIARPNPWTSAFEFRRQLTADAILRGGGFAEVVRIQGEPRELHRLSPDAITIAADDATGEPVYRVSEKAGAGRTVPWPNMLHIAGVDGPDKKTGLPSLLQEAIAVDLAMASHQSDLFENGARPSGILSPEDSDLNAAALANLLKLFAEQAKDENAGSTVALPKKVKWTPITFSSVDAQFLELRRFAIADLARGFGVPLPLIGELERAVWKNVEELTRTFLTFGLLPWLLLWEGALARALLSAEEQESRFFEHNVDGIAKADLAARYTAFNKATAGAAWMAPNEVRRLDNLPPIAGGDELRQPLNTGPATTKDDEDDDA